MASVTRAIPVGLHCSNHRRHRQNHSLPPKRLLPPVRPPALLWRGFPAFATPKSAPPHASESGTVNLTVEEEEEGGPDAEMEALPDEFYDEEWQARQREKTREWHAYREKEEEAERRKEEEYREIAMRLERFPKAEVHKAKKLVSSFILAGEEIEERIGEAAETGELTEVVLMVIWNRLDLARKDDEKDAIRCLDLLYRRIEAEMLKRSASPAMRLLNELLSLHDGYDEEGWLKKCRTRMVETFPQEDPFSLLVPAGFDIDTHEGPIPMPLDDKDILLRADFICEVNDFLKEVRDMQKNEQPPDGFDAKSVANRLKHEEKQRAMRQVESLLKLAVKLEW